jgi:hypothetical protein
MESAAAPLNPSSRANVHDDFLQLFKEEGLEDLAREVGILQNGQIPALRQYRKLSVVRRRTFDRRSFLFVG